MSGPRAASVPRTGQHLSVHDLRSVLAGAVRERVAGPDGARRAQELWASPGTRWFAADRPIQRVHADAAMFVGGLRALLLQSLHPLAMAGVAGHSDYRRDPWGRLQRTADFLAATTFGPADQAEAAVARVRSVHRRVRGVAPDGRAYSAGDPHLLAWVHLVEVESFLASHQHFGEHRLDPDEADAYVADMAKIASALGVPDPPTTTAELRAARRRYLEELRSTAPARDAAWFLFVPPLPLAARAPYAVLSAAAVSLLPWWARLGLLLPPATPVADALVVRPAATAVVGVLRWALRDGVRAQPAA